MRVIAITMQNAHKIEEHFQCLLSMSFRQHLYNGGPVSLDIVALMAVTISLIASELFVLSKIMLENRIGSFNKCINYFCVTSLS